jgi:Ser/Thr protein kinase RdoA (MazF antagonist)
MSRGRFVLCLEDVGARGVTFPVIDTPHADKRVEAVLDALATLHASCWGWPPRGVWSDETRPPFLRLIADSTLRTITKRWPSLLSADVVATYQLYLDHYDAVRAHWSSGLLVLVHGDSHLGNVFFHEKDGSAGFYDMQCVAAEHPMRDVSYHLILSCDVDDLARNEEKYVEAYLRRLAAKGPAQCANQTARRLRHAIDATSARWRGAAAPNSLVDLDTGQRLSYEDAWREYRLHALWALTALIISAGASADYFAEGPARLTISRAAAAVERFDARGALLDLID